ncbi:hypothetical protein AURDEDRAFT_176167 [Auricularia subglabra TFB-10046 SS5]|uniref:DUF6533 domain-containing protein n=1 Tax=Auricularia subglabra (strain TFB-10046 / SS5) TaxID=717982 RepID=J0WQF3_AURST|nr:hypothetical protein AURDEDRAFT_176167 [Auricularia subglabra TFB-10046 SS5]
MSHPDGSESLLVKGVIAALASARPFYNLIVTAAALFFYDHVLTLSAEIDLVWRSKWSVGKALFLVERYMKWAELGVMFYYDWINSSVPDCLPIYSYTMYSLLLGVVIADVILILRTWALWDTSRLVIILLSVLLCAITAANYYFVAYYLRTLNFFPLDKVDPRAASIFDNKFCLATKLSNRFAIIWVSIAAFELVIFIMTAIKGFGHFRQQSSSLISAIYRDSMLYFVSIFGSPPLHGSRVLQQSLQVSRRRMRSLYTQARTTLYF